MTHEGFYKPKEVVALLRKHGLDLSEMTVYRLIADGTFPARRIGRRLFVRRGPVGQFLYEMTGDSKPIDEGAA